MKDVDEEFIDNNNSDYIAIADEQEYIQEIGNSMLRPMQRPRSRLSPHPNLSQSEIEEMNNTLSLNIKLW